MGTPRNDQGHSTSTRPRILVLASTFPVTPGDGTPAFVYDLCRGLREEYEVLVVAPRVGDAPSRGLVGEVPVRRFAYFPKPWEQLADGAILSNLRAEPRLAIQVLPFVAGFAGAVMRTVREWRPQIVHAHWLVPGGVIATLVKQVFGVPYIVTVHGADVFALDRFGWLKRLVVRNASFVGPTSQEAADALPTVRKPPPREVIPMGVDVDGIARSVGERRPEPGRLLFVGRLAEKKGVDVLLKAVARVPEVRLIIGGSGADATRLSTLADKLGVTMRVEFTGRLTRDEVLDQLHRAQAVVIPSRVARDGDQDTTPLVMSESMSVGVPVIVSALGGLRAMTRDGETGVLVEPGSVRSLATALRRAIDEPAELERMGVNAQREIRGGPLDLKRTHRDYLRVIATVLSRTASSG